MTLALRRTVFADGERRPDDYEVRYKGRTVGRILRLLEQGRRCCRRGGEPGRAGPAKNSRAVRPQLALREV